jgi:hypothetical protein
MKDVYSRSRRALATTDVENDHVRISEHVGSPRDHFNYQFGHWVGRASKLLEEQSRPLGTYILADTQRNRGQKLNL